MQQTDDIRRRMARIRRELDQDVGAVVENARELTDWRNFVKRHPVLSVSAAVAVGFIFVPNRLNVVSPDAATLEKLAKKNRLVVKPKPDVKQQASVARPMINFIAGAVMRSALNFAGQQVGKAFSPESSLETSGDVMTRQQEGI